MSVFLYARAIRYVHRLPPEPETVVGRLLATAATPGMLVAVRARAPRFDTDWNTANNFEDPRVFYLSRTKGWLIANDEAGSVSLSSPVEARVSMHTSIRSHTTPHLRPGSLPTPNGSPACPKGMSTD